MATATICPTSGCVQQNTQQDVHHAHHVSYSVLVYESHERERIKAVYHDLQQAQDQYARNGCDCDYVAEVWSGEHRLYVEELKEMSVNVLEKKMRAVGLVTA
jgi:hypothetical protein